MEKYNGWSNYETWVINLWLTNDQATYAWIMEEIERIYSGQSFALAEYLEEFVEDMKPQLEGMFSDLLNMSLSKVYWHEIAQSFLED